MRPDFISLEALPAWWNCSGIAVDAKDADVIVVNTCGFVDAAKKDTAAEDFRKAMTTIQHTLLDLEDAVAAKKVDDIKTLLGKLDDIEKMGHAEFKVGS